MCNSLVIYFLKMTARQKTLADVLQAVAAGTPPELTQEYFLAGSVLDTQKDALVHRLIAISDSKSQPFFEHEVLLGFRSENSPKIELRFRRTLDPKDGVPCYLRYNGQTMDAERATVGLGPVAPAPCNIRHIVEAAVSPNVIDVLREVGFIPEFEYVAKGVTFCRGNVRITLSKVHRVVQPGNPMGQLEPLSKSWLIELSCLTDGPQPAAIEQIRAAADCLRPQIEIVKQ